MRSYDDGMPWGRVDEPQRLPFTADWPPSRPMGASASLAEAFGGGGKSALRREAIVRSDRGPGLQ